MVTSGMSVCSMFLPWDNIPNWIHGEYHTFSYQVVDIVDENGVLQEINIYMWIDGNPWVPYYSNSEYIYYDELTVTSYYRITREHDAYWKEYFATPAYFLANQALTNNAQVFNQVKSITIG